MKDKLLRTVRRFGMFAPGDTVAVGVSGGADSMCLLSLLRECAAELGVTLTAVHVNHGVRGAESDRDEAFVARLCAAAGITFVVRRVCVPELARQSGESTELCARRVRYEIFRSLGADKIATAHTGSDRAETLLMNLSRGTGLRGLCSIPPVRGNIVRPLYDFTRAETERYCREHEIPFVTDSTNLRDDYTRNRFRHSVIPALAAVNPAFEANALRCMELLRQDEQYLRSLAENRFAALFDPQDGTLSAEGLAGEPESLRSRVLILFLERVSSADFEYRHVSALSEGLEKGVCVTLPSGASVVSDGKTVRVRPPASPAEEPPRAVLFGKDETVPVPFGPFLLRIAAADRPSEDENALCLDYKKVGERLTARTRLAGDRIRLPRRGCSKTLKKYFNEISLPARQRDALPVICDENGVVAVAGLTADASRLPDESTKKYLIIRTECEKYDE